MDQHSGFYLTWSERNYSFLTEFRHCCMIYKISLRTGIFALPVPLRVEMKRFIAFCFVLIFAFGISGCAVGDTAADNDAGLTIAATVFPAYDFAREIGGERVNVTLLVPPGSESHSYEPTPQDILLLGRCDLLVANGGESEAWLDTVTEGLDSPVETLYMLDCVHALEEETKDGMQTGGILSRGHDEHDQDDGDEIEYDEHVWTSPANAILICSAVCERLCAIDPDGEEYYRNNCAEYTAKLRELDESFRGVVENGTRKTLIFADRFPVRYFVEEYGLDYYAAFLGCADDAEPSARTVAFLIDKVREEDIPAVFYIEFSNQKMADIICEETGCEKLLFHSCHNITADELAQGVSYYELMERNLANVKEALG